MLWLSSQKCGCILSNRHSLTRLTCFFVCGEDSSSVHSASFQNDSCDRCLALYIVCVSFWPLHLKIWSTWNFFERRKWLEKPRMALWSVWEALVIINQTAEWLVCSVVLAKEASNPHRENILFCSAPVCFPPPVHREQNVRQWNEIRLKCIYSCLFSGNNSIWTGTRVASVVRLDADS